MSTKTKTLAKSLHTVTALARVAEYIKKTTTGVELSNKGAIARALDLLGYADAADPYDLAGKALKAMEG